MNRRLGLALAAVPLITGGCGSAASSTSDGGGTHVMPDGTVMSGSNMQEAPGSDPVAADPAHGPAPSRTASMICGDEIREAVRRTLDLPRTPAGLHAWQHRLFSCTYPLAGGDLRLSVKDLDSSRPGRAYFDHLRARLTGAVAIRGLASFGLPAIQTRRGDVVFIKDHKTLWVDASRLEPRDVPARTTRQDVAYAVAAAVIGCWTE